MLTEDVIVHAQGRVTAAEHAHAHDTMVRLVRDAPCRVRTARVDLIVWPDAVEADAALAKAELDVAPKILRANAHAGLVSVAIDLLDAQLRAGLWQLMDPDPGQPERASGAVPTRMSNAGPPAQDREIVRRKAFALDAVTPEEAFADLERLDHDFYVFRNALTHADAVIRRIGEHRYELIDSASGTQSLDDAVERLDFSEDPFVFFLDVRTGRGSIVYRRHDGHYGLIVAVAPSD